MAEVLLFHHALGLTAGVRSFADGLRAAGHVVHLPDLFEGRTFADLAEGVRHAEEEVGFPTLLERGGRAAERLSPRLVHAGFSLGVLPAQLLAQTRPGAAGAVFMHAAVPLAEFGGTWPAGVPLQLHAMEGDALGDVEIARELAGTIGEAELFLYPGDGHLFADPGSPDHDAGAASLLMQRVLAFLDGIG